MPASRSLSASWPLAPSMSAIPATSTPKPHAGVIDVQIDLGLVAAEPVVLGARRLERGVERRQVGRLGGVDAAGEHVDRGGARQDGGVDVGAAVEQVLLQGERTHAVAEQDERDAGVVGARPSRRARPCRRSGRTSQRCRGCRGGRRCQPFVRGHDGRWRTRRTRRRRAPRRCGDSGRRARPCRGRAARSPSGHHHPPSDTRRPARRRCSRS